MSVTDVELAREGLRRFVNAPSAFVMCANPVWGSTETVNEIALFDTREGAEAYERASRLPDGVTTPDGIRRTYRPDSLLYDYNPPPPQSQTWLLPMLPWHFYDGLAVNPVPPSGPVPPMRSYEGARYGRDYDRGLGGPYTNMNGVRPGETP